MAQAELELDLKLKNVGKRLGELEKKAETGGEKAGVSFGKGMKKGLSTVDILAGNLAAKAIATAARVITQGIGSAVDSARSFSKGLAEINSILPATERLTSRTKNSFIEMSKAYGTNSTQQAKSFYDVVSAGIKGTSTQLATLEAANKASIAGLTDIGSVTKVLVSSMNAYKRVNLTAQQASDSLFVAVREGLTTFGELASSMGNVAPIASQVGVSFQELSGAVAFITKSGVATDTAVIQLRQTLASVLKPTKEASDEAQKLGLNFTAAALKAQGFTKFMKGVREATGGNSESLTKLFGNIRALSGVMNIVSGDFEDFQRIMKETETSAGATSDAFKVIEENIDFKIDKLTSNFKAFGQELAMITVPILLSLTEAAKTAFGALSFRPEIPTDTLAGVDQEIMATKALIDQLKAEQEADNFSFLDGLLGQKESNAERLVTLTASLSELKRRGDELFKDNFVGPMPFEIAVTSSVDKTKAEFAALEAAAAQSAAAISKIVQAQLVNGVAGGMLALTGALASGANAFEAFGGAVANILGDMMINVGKSILMQSTAIQALRIALTTLFPGAGIVAGIALIAAGGLMKNAGASLSGAATAGSGGSTATSEPDTASSVTDTLPDIDEDEAKTTVSLTVQGDVLDSDQTSLRIVDLLNSAYDQSGITLNQAFA